MNTKILKGVASDWLRYTKQCLMVTFERGLNHYDHPDVYGLLPDRQLVEIELKISETDFYADLEKKKWQLHGKSGYITPAYFYFLCPSSLVDTIQKRIPEYCGLLTVPDPYDIRVVSHLPLLKSVIKAVKNPHSEKVSIRNCIKMAKDQAATVCKWANDDAKKEYHEWISKNPRKPQ